MIFYHYFKILEYCFDTFLYFYKINNIFVSKKKIIEPFYLFS